MSAARSRGTTSRSGKKAKDVPKSASELKREKQQHDFAFNSEEAVAMRAEIRLMRAERDNETRVTHDCQQQKTKMEQFHELAKKEREELKMSLRNSLRQKQDLEEKQAYELKVSMHPCVDAVHVLAGAKWSRIQHANADCVCGVFAGFCLSRSTRAR